MLKIGLFFFSLVLVSSETGTSLFPWPSVFEIIRFPNDPCTTRNGLVGTCYTKRECYKHRGQPMGWCAKGFGVCCLFETTCGGVMKENNTYFHNAGYPDSSNLSTNCEVIIYPIERNSGICQFHLSLEYLELSSPTNGRCEGYSDSWTFSVGNRSQVYYGLPVNGLCGVLTNQHFYLDTKDETLSMRITPVFDSENKETKWRVRISQITCDSVYKAPSGCLQYYSGQKDQISSFNFGHQIGSSYFDDLQYAVCVTSDHNYCTILWEAALDNFEFGGAGLIGSGVGEVECVDDYVIIPTGSTVDRYCGSALNTISAQNINQPVISNHKPFILRVKSNQNGVRKGFKLSYTLMPCI